MKTYFLSLSRMEIYGPRIFIRFNNLDKTTHEERAANKRTSERLDSLSTWGGYDKTRIFNRDGSITYGWEFPSGNASNLTEAIKYLELHGYTKSHLLPET